MMLAAASTQSQGTPSSIAFYYGPVDSVRELLSYDRVVVSPTHITDRQISQLHAANIQVFAYLSIGEWDNSLGAVPAHSTILTQNTDWNASVMDLGNSDWRSYLLSLAQMLNSKGFDGLFLDTLDSYTLAGLSATNLATQQTALIEILNALAQSEQSDASVELILNRGFELINRLAFKPQAVVAESMIHGYNAAVDSYFTRTMEDTQWVSDRLKEVQDEGIEAIVIDYLPSHRHQDRIDAAKDLVELGFTPYLSNGLLTDMGVSTVYPVPRRVLVFYNGDEYPKNLSLCHRFLAVLIEYKGYVPECFDVNEIDTLLFDRAKYAGVVYWLSQSNYSSTALSSFIESALQVQNVYSLFIGELPESRSLLERLHLQAAGNYQGNLSTNLSQLGYPMPTASLNVVPRFVLAPNAETADVSVNIEITDAQGDSGIGSMGTSWGGVVTEALTVQEMMGDRLRWSLDPFEHVLPLLRLPEIPVPDVTTESGNRILTAHIDGDGFPSVTYTSEGIFAGESVLKEVLQRYDLPHTVSIIEAEIAPHGLYPQFSTQLETIAKNIFSLNHVEIASHTYSHPFFWDDRVTPENRLYGDSLDIPGYEIDFDREVFGSVEYIERELIPSGSEKKVKVFLWSGNANPTPDIIEKPEELGIYNVNGGNTFVVNGNFSIAQVFPHLNWYPTAVQVYAPLTNENLFTELWTDNFNGFSRAIESFQLLGEPRRLKPISIYYHMYSGVYPASIRALHQVYDWAISQPITPMFLSEYAARASALYETGLAKSIRHNITDNNWEVISTGVRSLRIKNNMSPTADSIGIAGMNAGPDGNYLALSGTRATLSLLQDDLLPPFGGRPYLQSANGIIHDWHWDGEDLLIEVESYMPLQMSIEQASNCQLIQPDAQIKNRRSDTVMSIASTHSGRHRMRLQCLQESKAP